MLTRNTRTITDSFNTCVEKLIGALDQKLSLKLDMQSSEMFDLHKRVDTLDDKLQNLHAENVTLRETIKSLNARVDKVGVTHDDIEQYSRSDNLLIFGVSRDSGSMPETQLGKKVIDLINTNIPGVNIAETDISVVHRIGRPPVSPAPSGGISKPQPVVVRFTRRSMRNNILLRRKELKGKSISISEQLTSDRAKLLKKASDLVTSKRLQGAWSHDGKVLIILSDNSIRQVSMESDLIQFSIG